VKEGAHYENKQANLQNPAHRLANGRRQSCERQKQISIDASLVRVGWFFYNTSHFGSTDSGSCYFGYSLAVCTNAFLYEKEKRITTDKGGQAVSIEDRILNIAQAPSWEDRNELRAIALEVRKLEDRIKQLEAKLDELQDLKKWLEGR
jgi:hypothetical protein